MSEVSLPDHEPRCPHCMKPFRGSFPTDSDEAPVTCPACGKVAPAAGWFAYDGDDDGDDDTED